MWSIRWLTAVWTLLLPALAFAQVPPDWTSRVQIGKPLFVTTASGDRMEGLAGQVTTDGLVVATPVGIRTLTYGEIRKVERRDSVWSGVAIGATLGLAVGVVVRAGADCQTPTCRAEANSALGGGAVYGALIGWGIDAALKGRQTLFERESSPIPISLAVRHRGIAASAAITW